MPDDFERIHTDIIRTMVQNVRQDAAALRIRLHRLQAVAEQYAGFADWLRFELSEAAGILAITTLAKHKDRDECLANFDAFVDIAYSAIAESTRELTPRECERLRITADAIHAHVHPKLGKIVSESQLALAKIDLDDAHPTLVSFRLAASLLRVLRTVYVQFAPSNLLVDNILACGCLCSSLEGLFMGRNISQNVIADAKRVIESANACLAYVHRRIELGELVVVNGRVSNPRE